MKDSRLKQLKKLHSIKYFEEAGENFVPKIGHVTLYLLDAKLCLNCDAIYTGALACPTCTSPQWEWLAKWVPPLEVRTRPVPWGVRYKMVETDAANAKETKVPE